MLRIKDIVKYKGLVLILGVVLGVAIVGLPMMPPEDQAITEMEKQGEDSSETSAFTTSFEAVAPSPIFQDASTIYFILDEILLVEEIDISFEFEFLEVFSENLIRVLFNFIIAPNAP